MPIGMFFFDLSVPQAIFAGPFRFAIRWAAVYLST